MMIHLPREKPTALISQAEMRRKSALNHEYLHDQFLFETSLCSNKNKTDECNCMFTPFLLLTKTTTFVIIILCIEIRTLIIANFTNGTVVKVY